MVGVNRGWVDAHLAVVARLAHREPLAGGGVLLELGRAPVLDLRGLARVVDARRVRARGLERKSRVSDRVGQDVQSKTSPPSWSTWCKSARPPSPACRCGRSGSPWRRASPIRPRRRTRGRRSRRQPARRREVRWDTVERNTSMGPAGTHLVSQVALLADLLLGVLAGAPPARLASLAHGAQDGAVAHGAPVALGARDDVVLHAVDDVRQRQDHERAGALAPLPLQLPLQLHLLAQRREHLLLRRRLLRGGLLAQRLDPLLLRRRLLRGGPLAQRREHLLPRRRLLRGGPIAQRLHQLLHPRRLLSLLHPARPHPGRVLRLARHLPVLLPLLDPLGEPRRHLRRDLEQAAVLLELRQERVEGARRPAEVHEQVRHASDEALREPPRRPDGRRQAHVNGLGVDITVQLGPQGALRGHIRRAVLRHPFACL
eukprot:30634-Pelagococcus_subviridis.AAC.1